MARLSNSDSRRMYSWWWDSHISPKNSKWLQENLTDMDAKVKVMIKLIEEDADSFARRAEMYYKKRPELMKLVEEFYRAYRALAERYDHATGVIRHAHHTMSEAFPNQVPSFADDQPSNSVSGTDSRTPDTSILHREFSEELDSVPRSQDFNKKARKSINFDKAEEKGPSTLCNEDKHVKDKNLSESDHVSDSEEILISKEALSKLEVEKETGLVQYQQSLDKLTQLELEISQTQEELRVLGDQATKAENEVVVLKEYLSKLESEKESKIQGYQQYLEKISDLQSTVAIYEANAKKLDETAINAEMEVQTVKDELAKLAVEKDAALSQYMESLDTISNLENKLKLAEEDALRLKEGAEIAESEVESLKHTISELERSNQSLHSELESLMSKMGTQTRELTEKQKELGKFWACIQEERLHFVESETDFQTLQHLHAQTQEDLRYMASELQDKAELLKVVETRNHSLLDEVLKVKEENKHLDELNALSIKGMQNEISNLRESKGKLLEEVEPILEERNALQQEIYILKEELNNLQEENSNLKETFHRDNIDKTALLEKRELLGQLLEKNSILENSLSKANDELLAVRRKIEALEKSCESLLKEKCILLDEKDTLMIQLKETDKNLEKLSENNTILVSSLSGARRQVEISKAKSKILEDSCQLLVNEKEDLISEKDGLTSLLDNTRRRLEDLVKIYGKLQGRCMTLEKEKESTLRKVEELQMSLDVQRQEFSSYIRMNETRFTSVEAEMKFLHQECQGRKRELDQVIDNAVENEIEIFVLRITAKELAENNGSFLVKNQKLLDNLSLSENTISQLQKANCEQEMEIKSLSDQLEFKVRTEQIGVSQSEVLRLLDINEELRSKLRKEECNREALVARFEDLNKKLVDIHGNCEVLQREKSGVFAEKRSLMDNFRHLEEKNNVLEEENCDLYGKVFALENFSLILRSCTDEKLKLLREYGDNLVKLDELSAALTEKLNLAERKLEIVNTENLHLQENLQKSEDQLKNIASIKDQLTTELENGKKMLHQLKLELQQGQEKLSIAEEETIELHRSLEGLKVEYNEVKRVQDSKRKQISKISAKNDHLIRENIRLHGASQVMEDELHKFHEEHNQRKIQEDNLQLELQSKINEINKLETETVCQFQCSMVSQLLYEHKFRELREACLGYLDQIENLKSQLAAYGPEIVCLMECVSSLENHTGMHIKFQNPHNEAVQGAHVTQEPHGSILNEDKKELMPHPFSDLHDLRYRLQGIEKAAVEIKELTVQENIDLHSKLDTAVKQLELLKHGSGRYRRNSKPTSEITEAYNTVLTKDIVLDQVSDGSYNGFSKREPLNTDDQIVELWETADPNGTIGLTVGKSKNIVSPSKSSNTDFHRVKSVRKQKGKFHISDALVEKEMSIDKVEIYRRSTTPHQEGNRRKILERLDSDVQKLANLQITVQDLKRKLAVTEKGRRGKAVLECEALKLQLEEADIAIMKLFDLNGRLTKSMEEGSSFTEIKSSFDLENDGSATRRRRVSDQARRMSEKIGMLQLEVQKFQFVLLKMDNEKGVKVNTPETRRRILLRDFIYGGGRTGQRRKKAQCCVCVQPSTSDD